MDVGDGRHTAVPSVSVDVAEYGDPSRWAALPTHDRVFSGDRTVYLEPFDTPLIVTQPNRWGVVESSFPDVPCVVECDPVVAAALPTPAVVEVWLDRCHRPIDPPGRRARAAEVIDRAARFAGTLGQIRGVSAAARPFARTIPLLVPVAIGALIDAAARAGVTGIRALGGLGGGIALSVSPDHTDDDLATVRRVLGDLIS